LLFTKQNRSIQDFLKSYLSCQKEIYGNDIVLDKPDLINNIFYSQNKNDLSEIYKEVAECKRCPLHKTVNKKVVGEGNENAKLVLVGEAPGREEDISGKPFVGKAGQLLDNILKAIGFSRDEVFICNVLKCRPPQNRDPKPEEINECFPYLERQIEAINPGIILALGRFAGNTLLRKEMALGNLRKEVHDYNGRPVFVTYHPAALLRDKSKKYLVWEDVQKLRRTYDTIIGDKPPWQKPGK